MYPATVFVLSALVLILLLQLNTLFGLAFFIATLVMIPTLVLHRRDVAAVLEGGDPLDPPHRTWVRAVAMVGLGASGITLGVPLFLLAVVIARLLTGPTL